MRAKMFYLNNNTGHINEFTTAHDIVDIKVVTTSYDNELVTIFYKDEKDNTNEDTQLFDIVEEE